MTDSKLAQPPYPKDFISSKVIHLVNLNQFLQRETISITPLGNNKDGKFATFDLGRSTAKYTITKTGSTKVVGDSAISRTPLRVSVEFQQKGDETIISLAVKKLGKNNQNKNNIRINRKVIEEGVTVKVKIGDIVSMTDVQVFPGDDLEKPKNANSFAWQIQLGDPSKTEVIDIEDDQNNESQATSQYYHTADQQSAIVVFLDSDDEEEEKKEEVVSDCKSESESEGEGVRSESDTEDEEEKMNECAICLGIVAKPWSCSMSCAGCVCEGCNDEYNLECIFCKKATTRNRSIDTFVKKYVEKLGKDLAKGSLSTPTEKAVRKRADINDWLGKMSENQNRFWEDCKPGKKKIKGSKRSASPAIEGVGAGAGAGVAGEKKQKTGKNEQEVAQRVEHIVHL